MRVPAVAATIALGSALSCVACSSPYEPPEHADAAHAIATVYLREPLDRGFRLEGTFSLPRVPFNRGWYADWFTYTAKPTATVPEPPFVQAGLIRSLDHEFALQPFVAFRRRGGAAVLRALAVIPNGPHRVALAAHGGKVEFAVDGVVRYRAAARDFLAPEARAAYVQIGHELSVQDDFAKGSIRALAFSSGPKLAPLGARDLACSYSSNGVRWQHGGASLVAAGKFDAAVADALDCVAPSGGSGGTAAPTWLGQ